MTAASCAAAAAPAINERPPAARPAGKTRFEMARDIAADQRGADFLGIERRFLLVDGADARALGVAEHRAADRAGDVVLRELRLGTHVDHLVKLGELCYVNQRGVLPCGGVWMVCFGHTDRRMRNYRFLESRLVYTEIFH